MNLMNIRDKFLISIFFAVAGMFCAIEASSSSSSSASSSSNSKMKVDHGNARASVASSAAPQVASAIDIQRGPSGSMLLEMQEIQRRPTLSPMVSSEETVKPKEKFLYFKLDCSSSSPSGASSSSNSKMQVDYKGAGDSVASSAAAKAASAGAAQTANANSKSAAHTALYVCERDRIKGTFVKISPKGSFVCLRPMSETEDLTLLYSRKNKTTQKLPTIDYQHEFSPTEEHVYGISSLNPLDKSRKGTRAPHASIYSTHSGERIFGPIMGDACALSIKGDVFAVHTNSIESLWRNDSRFMMKYGLSPDNNYVWRLTNGTISVFDRETEKWVINYARGYQCRFSDTHPICYIRNSPSEFGKEIYIYCLKTGEEISGNTATDSRIYRANNREYAIIFKGGSSYIRGQLVSHETLRQTCVYDWSDMRMILGPLKNWWLYNAEESTLKSIVSHHDGKSTYDGEHDLPKKRQYTCFGHVILVPYKSNDNKGELMLGFPLNVKKVAFQDDFVFVEQNNMVSAYHVPSLVAKQDEFSKAKGQLWSFTIDPAILDDRKNQLWSCRGRLQVVQDNLLCVQEDDKVVIYEFSDTEKNNQSACTIQ